jgi:hypothetical protein
MNSSVRLAPWAKVFRNGPASPVINVFTALAAFICTSAALHAWLPSPEVRDVGPKLRFFASHRDEFDTIFVGSSHVHNGISPSVFDEVLASAGMPNRTFNFGADGMFPPEQFYLLEQILVMKPRKLKRIFLEIGNVEVTWLPGQENSQRAVYWHDWKRTEIVLRKIFEADVDEPWPRKLRTLRRWRETIIRHLALLGRNLGNVGRAFDLAKSLAGPGEAEWELGPALDGYFPLTANMPEEQAAAFQRELAREESAGIQKVALDPYAAAAYRGYAGAIRRAGVTPVFIVPPVYPQFPSQFSGVSPALILAYNDPSLYPDFYRPELRVDQHHLNAAAVESFTRLVAADFLKNTQHP